MNAHPEHNGSGPSNRTVDVGFVFEATDWLGGRNYLRNLFAALTTLEKPTIRPTMFVPPRQSSEIAAEFSATRTVSTSYFDRGTAGWLARRTTAGIITKDLLFRRLLKKHEISVLSHYGRRLSELGGDTPIIGWIPDFQHMHLKEFFDAAELKQRDREFLSTCEVSRTIIVSSESARKDLTAFAPRFAAKARVLRFVASPFFDPAPPSVSELQQKYSFKEPYVLLPNQFWAHKNHRVVISALKILRSRGQRVMVIATGKTSDCRNPGYYEELTAFAGACCVLDSFRVLGIVPFRDLSALMHNSIAILNPSRFEGWSTSVEEAKSAGKRTILSDIAVHREQAPELAAYFQADDPEGLAGALWSAFQNFDPASDLDARRKAKERVVVRQRQFAKTYETIVLDSIGITN